MRKSVHSATLGDLVEDAMRRHFAIDLRELEAARRLAFWVPTGLVLAAVALATWGVLR